MSSNENNGYKGPSALLLSSAGVKVSDRVRVVEVDGELDGVLMPRYESADRDHVVIKLKSGYNVGIKISNIKSIVKLSDAKSDTSLVSNIESPVIEKTELPRIALISTGGTIASKIDYRTGGVRAALTAEELYESVPELGDIASVVPHVLFSEYSENLMPAHWSRISEEVANRVKSGEYAGIVVSHGTDTMHYTSSALSFALQGLPIPVVLVGAQRSSDRPSSDAASNLVAATLFASRSGCSGVFVVMHENTSDDLFSCHIGSRVRKDHTSRRDAFESIDVPPVAKIKGAKIEITESWSKKLLPSKGQFDPRTAFDDRVSLIKYYPGFDAEMIEQSVARGCKAIILEGTGLGHVGRHCFPSIKSAIESGVLVFMTSQCIWGRVRMTVYDTGRDLLDMGVVPISDMLSETALTKAMWALANTGSLEETKRTMQSSLAHEITDAIML